MRNSTFLIAVLALICAAATPIPPEKALIATVKSYLTMPANQPAMQMPTAVAVNSKGDAFVADGALNRIIRFPGNGTAPEAFRPDVRQPTGLFVDAADQLWVADTGHAKIIRIDDKGTIVDSLPLRPNGDQPAKPTDLLVDEDHSRLYVVDNQNHRLLVRDQKSGQWSTLGAPGTSLGQFQYPFMIAGRKGSDLYITESLGARVQILSSDNQWKGAISQFGIQLGDLYRPKGVAIDEKGRVFVSDSTFRVIQVFTSQGALAGILTDANRQPLRFEHPMGLRFDRAGKLFVVELKANRVAIVELGGSP